MTAVARFEEVSTFAYNRGTVTYKSALDLSNMEPDPEESHQASLVRSAPVLINRSVSVDLSRKRADAWQAEDMLKFTRDFEEILRKNINLSNRQHTGDRRNFKSNAEEEITMETDSIPDSASDYEVLLVRKYSSSSNYDELLARNCPSTTSEEFVMVEHADAIMDANSAENPNTGESDAIVDMDSYVVIEEAIASENDTNPDNEPVSTQNEDERDNKSNKLCVTNVKVKYNFNAKVNKKKKNKEQGRNKKWKRTHVDSLGFDLSLMPWRNPESVITDDMMKELSTFETLCQTDKVSDPAPSTSDASDEKKVCVNDNDAIPGPSTSNATEEMLCETDSDTNPVPSTIGASENRVKQAPDLSAETKTSSASNTNSKPAYVYCETIWDDGLDYEGSMERRLNSLYFDNKKFYHLDEDYSGLLRYGAKRLRHKKKWRNPKARKQIKTKYCANVNNLAHGVELYVKHRVSKRMPLIINKFASRPSKPSIKQIDKRAHIDDMKSTVSAAPHAQTLPPGPRTVPVRRTRGTRDTPPPAYALTAYNADGELQPELVNIMLNLQDRDLTPEDYEILLQLDERVPVKTIDTKTIEALREDTISESGEGDICAVCMGEYLVGLKRKYLPCGHYFHSECVIEWLNNSTTCPLDGLEVSP